jgi:hypothetical protein
MPRCQLTLTITCTLMCTNASIVVLASSRHTWQDGTGVICDPISDRGVIATQNCVVVGTPTPLQRHCGHQNPITTQMLLFALTGRLRHCGCGFEGRNTLRLIISRTRPLPQWWPKSTGNLQVLTCIRRVFMSLQALTCVHPSWGPSSHADE